MTTGKALDRGREAFDRQAWGDAYAQLSVADQEASLEAEDLERLATAAYLLGRDADCTDIGARAYHSCLERGEVGQAARCAFWLALGLLLRGETARGGGWLARAERLVSHGPAECVEQGYLLVPTAFQRMDEGDNATANAAFTQAAEIGERFSDSDLITLGGLGRGQTLIGLGETEEGVALLDEVMVAVTAGEVSSGSSTAS